MTDNLFTRNVFIDTSVFVAENFNFKGTKFETLASMAQQDRILVKSTDITFAEIISNIRESVEEAEKTILKAKTKARVLKNLGAESPYRTIFSDFPQDDIIQQLVKQLEDYFRFSKTETISALDTSPSTVFEKYFGKKPPFGLGKKKSEFPDAFVLAALDGWCKQSGQKVFVISQDSDMASVCRDSETLLYLPSLENFLELVIAKDEELSQLAHERLQKNSERIKTLISDELEDTLVILMDQDGEGTITSVHDISLGAPSIIQINNHVATFEFQCSISFAAEVCFDDLDTASYDSEEGRLIPWREIERDVEREIETSVELAFAFSSDDADYFLLHHIMINDGEPLKLWADEDAETYYK